MLRYVKNYEGGSSIFKIAKTFHVHDEYMKKGFNHLFNNSGTIILYTYDGYININIDKRIFDEKDEKDVLIIDSKGIISELYNANSTNNAICITLQCNSNCVMCPCSEKSRKHNEISSINFLRELLYYLPKDSDFLTITGGEPTLLKNDLFVLLNALKNEFPKTYFQLLTNGRAFCNKNYAEKFNIYRPNNIQVGIPIYGYDSNTHDMITQTPGSFEQTIVGIHNLLNNNTNIEIRIVLTKQTIYNLYNISEFIINSLKSVNSVKLMGLEMLGNAVVNMDKVWMPYDELFNLAEGSINLLIKEGIDVAIYNFPLCTVKRDYWGICEKSISDYKIEYNEECNYCKVKNMCGGVFGSTRRVTNFKCNPIY